MAKSAVVALTVLATCLTTVACNRDLSREKAAELIVAANLLPGPQTILLPLGAHCGEPEMTWTTTESPENFLARRLDQNGPGTLLRSHGMIAATVKRVMIDPVMAGLRMGGMKGIDAPTGPCATMPPTFTPYYEWHVEITPEGRKAGIETLVTQIAVAEFEAVTGLAKDPSGITTAEYSYQWKRTPAGEKLNFLSIPDRQTAKVAFRLFDDGWRLDQ